MPLFFSIPPWSGCRRIRRTAGRSRAAAAALLLVIGATGGSGAAGAAPEQKRSAVQAHDFALWNRLIHLELDDNVAGGYAYEILQHGKIVASGQGGFARAPWEPIDPGVPFTLQKPAPLASVSKTITAVAMLKLWDERRKGFWGRFWGASGLFGVPPREGFSLDAPFWPIIKKIAPDANPGVKRITIRQVLMHQSGLARVRDITTHEALAKLLRRPPAHPPGSTFEYQDNNYYLARVILEELAHTSYQRYVKTHVLAPMGIARMETHSERRSPMCGYGEAESKEPGYPFAWDCARWAGGAGWYGSVEEMAKFMRGLRERKVLSEEATQMLFRNALGFDWAEPGFGKAGDWVRPSDADGEVHSAVCYFPDDIEAAMVINAAYQPGPLELLEDTWTQSRRARTKKKAKDLAVEWQGQ